MSWARVSKSMGRTLVWALALLVVASFAQFAWQLTPITHPRCYGFAKDTRWHRPQLVAHFPAEIPEEASAVRLFSRAGYLQGGSTLELHLALAPSTLESATAAAHAAMAGHPGQAAYAAHTEWPGYGELPKQLFHTGPRPEPAPAGAARALPADFELRVLHAMPYKHDPLSWNHGEAAGIAVSRERGTIVYWAEDW